jgi:hypothetical protein
MFNKEDILARLRAGEPQDNIAKEMADALNEASNDYKAEQEAQAKVDAYNVDKNLATAALLEAADDYFARYYPKVANEIKDLTTEEAIEIFDAFSDAFNILKDLDWYFKKPSPNSVELGVSSKKPAKASTVSDDEAIIRNWINKLLG